MRSKFEVKDNRPVKEKITFFLAGLLFWRGRKKVMVNTIAFATHNKPNFIKRFFMRTLLDFYWVKDTNNDKQ